MDLGDSSKALRRTGDSYQRCQHLLRSDVLSGTGAACVAELALGLDGRGRPSPHELGPPAQHRFARRRSLVQTGNARVVWGAEHELRVFLSLFRDRLNGL